MRPLLVRVASLACPDVGGHVVIDQGWIVIRIRRTSPQRYRVRVREPSVRGRSPRWLANHTIRGWGEARRYALHVLSREIERRTAAHA